MKKLVALGVFGAMIASALPAGAVTVPGTVTVKWNTAIVATLALANNYNSSGVAQTSAPAVFTNNNGGGGSCAGPAAEVAATVNFGTVTPDSAQTTNCVYDNAVNALVKTNSTSWQMTEALTATVTGTILCALANTAAGTFPIATGAALNVVQSTRTSNALTPSGAACPAGALTLTAAPSNTVSPNPSITAYPTGANIGEDLLLMVSPTGSTGNQQVTLNYSLVAN